jgi:protein-tyrosine phosphatase
MIDLHTHILPGIDDGPADLSGSLELAAAAEVEGIDTLAATPHVRVDHPRVRPAELRSRTDAMNRALGAAGLDVTVVAGAEVDVLWAHRASPEELRQASFGQRGHDVLLETPYGELPPNFEEVLFELGLRGYRILLAHPERNPTFQRDPRRLAALVDGGILIQVTAFTLAEPSRASRPRRLALDLVRDGLAHVIASDAHEAAGPRGAGLRQGVEAADRIAPLRGRWMVTEAPAAILAGEPLPSPPGAAGRRRLRLRRR